MPDNKKLISFSQTKKKKKSLKSIKLSISLNTPESPEDLLIGFMKI